jgi:ribosomal protein L13
MYVLWIVLHRQLFDPNLILSNELSLFSKKQQRLVRYTFQIRKGGAKNQTQSQMFTPKKNTTIWLDGLKWDLDDPVKF